MMDDRYIPIDEIPDSATIPDGMYTVRVALVTEAQTRERGKLMYKVSLRVEDGPFANAPLFDNFVIGSDDDPHAEERETWKRFGAVRFKQFLKATGCTLSQSRNELFDALSQQRCVVIVATEDGDRGPQNRISKYAGIGEVAPQARGNGSRREPTPQHGAAPRAAVAPRGSRAASPIDYE